MSKVTVYQFEVYDITSDGYRKSRRWGTRESIESVHGTILDETATDVDASAVASDIAGMTARGFNPHAHVGPQRQVTP